MSSQDTTKPHDGPKRSGSDYPVCPQCSRAMTVKQVVPLLFATGIDEVIYGCEDCGAQAKRTVKR